MINVTIELHGAVSRTRKVLAAAHSDRDDDAESNTIDAEPIEPTKEEDA